jgi:hypothetical protein
MARGRHRNSSPLRRSLPALAASSLACACAAGAWLSDDRLLLRAVVGAAAAATIAGAVLLRRRDRAAEKEITRLQTLRARLEFQSEEKIAELESDLEEFRQLRTRYARMLNAKRTELAGLRSEHAALLRRYATAESERAAALEAARLAQGPAPAPAAPLTPAAYLRADAALAALARNAAAQRGTPAPREEQGAQHRRPAVVDRPAVADRAPVRSVGPEALRPASRQTPAVAVVPPRPGGSRAHAETGGFDFFGARRALPAPAAPVAALPGGPPETATRDDMADVVGEEVTREREGDGRVIDLTEHDETEPLDLRELRAL